MATPASGPDAAQLRRAIYDKKSANRTDLVGLMTLGRDAADDPDFLALVGDVARDALVVDVDPSGYVSDADADWLTARLGDGAGLSCRSEFEALKSVLAHAVCVPPSLVAFAVREVERAILTGRRAPIGGAETEPGVVAASDVEALRAVCFAATAGATPHIDRATAEALFDIAHATATSRNDPAFPEFFAKAVGNHLLGAFVVALPTRNDALAREKRLDERASLGDFLMGLIGDDGSDGRKSVDQLAEEHYAHANAQTAARLEAAARIDAGEARWILSHLARGGELTPAEKRLLTFLRDEATAAPPEIAALFERAA